MNLSGVSKSTIVRAIVTFILMANMVFGYFGWKLIPATTTDVTNFVDSLIVLATVVVWAWGWWKNNSFTLNAQAADEVLKLLNAGESVEVVKED